MLDSWVTKDKELVLSQVQEVPAAGFEWAQGHEKLKPQATAFFLFAKSEMKGQSVRRYDPFVEAPALFRIFADTHPSLESFLAFANKYGWLSSRSAPSVVRHRPGSLWCDESEFGERLRQEATEDLRRGIEPSVGAYMRVREALEASSGGFTEEHAAKLASLLNLDYGTERAESEALWKESQSHLRVGLTLWDSITAGDLLSLESALEQAAEITCQPVGSPSPPHYLLAQPQYRVLLGGQPTDNHDPFLQARTLLRDLINIQLPRRVSLWMQVDPRDDSMGLRIVPNDLLGAMWLQFARAVAGNRRYRQCDACGLWFEVSPEQNRTNRRFCSTACRSKFYRRKKELARELRAEGLSVEDIATRLDSDTGTVGGWIGLKEVIGNAKEESRS